MLIENKENNTLLANRRRSGRLQRQTSAELDMGSPRSPPSSLSSDGSENSDNSDNTDSTSISMDNENNGSSPVHSPKMNSADTANDADTEEALESGSSDDEQTLSTSQSDSMSSSDDNSDSKEQSKPTHSKVSIPLLPLHRINKFRIQTNIASGSFG